MVLKISINDRALIQKLDRLPEKMRGAMKRKVTELTLKLESRVKQKLSGEVLNVKTGALRRSIHSTVEDTGSSITGKVASSGDVNYAAIHEFGGTIDHPGGTAYIPTASGAVQFISNEAAAAMKGALPRTRPHENPMPERSFLRSSLADMKQEIIDGLAAAVKEGLK